MTIPAEITVAPAAATAAVEQEVSLQERLNAATPEEYTTWERTGDIPPVKPKTSEAPPKPAESAPAQSSEPTKDTKAKPDASPAPKGETAAASPAAIPQKTETKSEKRWRELSEKFGNLQREHEELKRQSAKPAAETSDKPASQPAAEVKTEKRAKPKLTDNDPKTGKPFASLDAWSDAVDEWHDERFKSTLDERLAAETQSRTQSEQQRVRNEAMAAKLMPGKDKYPDFEKVAFNPDLTLPLGSPADEFLRSSDHAADLLYYLGQHPEILNGFYRYVPGKDDKPGKLTGVFEQLVHPLMQVAELARIEARLTAAPAAPVVPKPSASAPKPLPPPPTVLSTQSSAAGDPVEEAINKKSFADYEKAANAAERKARRA